MKPTKNGRRAGNLLLTIALGAALGISPVAAADAAAATWLGRLLGVDAKDVVVDRDGAAIVCGEGSHMGVVAKIGDDGVVVWAKRNPPTAGMFSNNRELARLDEGGAIFLAFWIDQGGNRRTFVVKIDKDGNRLGATEISPIFFKLAVAGDALYLAGGAESVLYLARLELASMRLVWSEAFTCKPGGGSSQPQVVLHQLRRDRDGGVVAACELLNAEAEGASDGLLFKADAAGNAVFSKRLGNGNLNHYIADVVPVSDGYVFVGGTQAGAGKTDLLAGKLDAAWGLRWLKALGGCGYDAPGQALLMKNGTVSVSIRTRSWSNTTQSDSALVNIDTANAFHVNWQKRYWTFEEEEPDQLAEANDGGVLLTALLTSGDYLFGGGSFAGGESYYAGMLIKTGASGEIAVSGCGRMPCPAVADLALGVSDTTATVGDYPLAASDCPVVAVACDLTLEDAYVTANKFCGD
jgi:hypothetical protein